MRWLGININFKQLYFNEQKSYHTNKRVGF